MRQTIAVFVLIGALLSGVTFAQAEEEALALEAKKIEFAHDMRAKELDLEAQDVKLDFERQMQEMELQERRAQIERPHRANTQRPHRGSYHHKKKHGGFACLIGLIMIIVRLLATIWVAGDLQRRKAGSALWIPIVLLGGLFGLGVYALVRLGDIQQTETA